MGNRNIIGERAVDSPGAAQKSMAINGVMVEEEEVFQLIQMQNSTTTTSNMDPVKLILINDMGLYLKL